MDYAKGRSVARWPGVLFLVFCTALAGVVYDRYREARSELERLDSIAALAPVTATSRLHDADLNEQAKQADAVMKALALPWAAIVKATEQSASPGVSLLQLQPDPDARLLRINAEAKDSDAMFTYVRRLSAARGVSDAHVLSHFVHQDDSRQPIRFSVQATLQ